MERMKKECFIYYASLKSIYGVLNLYEYLFGLKHIYDDLNYLEFCVHNYLYDIK